MQKGRILCQMSHASQMLLLRDMCQHLCKSSRGSERPWSCHGVSRSWGWELFGVVSVPLVWSPCRQTTTPWLFEQMQHVKQNIRIRYFKLTSAPSQTPPLITAIFNFFHNSPSRACFPALKLPMSCLRQPMSKYPKQVVTCFRHEG
jgi:hypothetical protein